MKRVFFRADDFGSCQAANRAILDCVRAGLVQNVGIMAPGVALGAEIEELKSSGADLGFHVVLNSEWNDLKWNPCAQKSLIPSLLDENGEFTWAPIELHNRGFSIEEAMIEVNAQYERLVELGFKLSYLDEHMGVGWLPGFRDRLHDFAAEKGLMTTTHLSYVSLPPQSDWNQQSLVSSFQGDGQIVMLHPAYRDGVTEGFVHAGLEPGQVAMEREIETLWFADEGNVRATFEAGIDPVKFSSLRQYH